MHARKTGVRSTFLRPVTAGAPITASVTEQPRTFSRSVKTQHASWPMVTCFLPHTHTHAQTDHRHVKESKRTYSHSHAHALTHKHTHMHMHTQECTLFRPTSANSFTDKTAVGGTIASRTVFCSVGHCNVSAIFLSIFVRLRSTSSGN